jgi:hypothetical protein
MLTRNSMIIQRFSPTSPRGQIPGAEERGFRPRRDGIPSQGWGKSHISNARWDSADPFIQVTHIPETSRAVHESAMTGSSGHKLERVHNKLDLNWM